MIPRIPETSPLHSRYLAFIEALQSCGFEGDLNPDYANRTVLATDNSIYQILPQGVIYPKNTADLVRITELSAMKQFREIILAPRGGGTGTNGQSLTSGLIIDISKHMNAILEINAEQRWVRVQAGVVKDQLNAALKPYGLFFAPELSTSNRATIGGMINTDASGQGSCLYGKTRDHVIELSTVFLDGREWNSRAISDEELEAICERQDRVGLVHRVINRLQKEFKSEIDASFPPLNRCLTGYDLAHIRDEKGQFNLNNILCGSEGTLGFITEAKLNLVKIPEYSALVNVNYKDFDTALRDASQLMLSDPASIETIDSKVLNLAMNDIVWNSVSEFFPQNGNQQVQGINLVEFTADTEPKLEQKVARLTAALDKALEQESTCIGYSIANGRDQVNKIWGMRKKAVGLLGNAKGSAKPVPFVEDTAVPPENLADFISEFRQLLDDNNLEYGMFGHVDAGVLHVRPALDMKDPEQEALIRPITDAVVKLVDKYNGLLWGEHGKGVRSEYAPVFFGELYSQLQRIKACFDPHNQLNPGKIATPSSEEQLLTIDGVPTRGQYDRRIPVKTRDTYSEAMNCNGNGVCFNWNPDDPMCPSWKGTRDRAQSPKGRASLIREWLRLLSERGVDPNQAAKESRSVSPVQTLLPKTKNTWHKLRGQYDFSHEVHTSMMGCLACKACASQCPVKVDVPEFRSKFLELYYSRYFRPVKDYFVGWLEYMLPALSQAPRVYNAIITPPFMQHLMAKFIGLVDSPLLSGISLDKALNQSGIEYASPHTLKNLSESEKRTSVILVQDAFTSYFETQLILDILEFLKKLGFTPYIAPFKPNGKPQHVHGFLKSFEKTAEANTAMLNALAESEIPLIGVDPSMTLTYRSEYKKIFGDRAPKVHLIQEWLATQFTQPVHEGDTPQKQASQKQGFQSNNGEALVDRFEAGAFKLLGHCTEKTNAAPAMKDWETVFSSCGQQLTTINSGCCGMAGTYGHESANIATSKTIYALSWSSIIKGEEHLMASGYSCRCQVKRMDQIELPHPVQILLKQMKPVQQND